ncbi:MAG: L-threonylcarbamoyladenylate synthase [Eubacteriales bacterium]
METKLWTTSEQDLKEAGKVLKNGGIVAFPTETVYGLGADALNADAVKKVYVAKGRPSDNPMIVHIHSVSQLGDLTPVVSEAMSVLAEKFWPGPLTMVVPKAACLPTVTTGGLDTVGVRLPASKAARKLISFAGCPIAAPSANLSGSPSPTVVRHVIGDLSGKVDGIVCGEACKIGIESTVVDVTDKVVTVLRPGYITQNQLEESLLKIGLRVEVDEHIVQMQNFAKNKLDLKLCGQDFKPKAPGMKYRHYAPKAKLIILIGKFEKVKAEMLKMTNELENSGKKVGNILLGDSDEDIELEMSTFFDKLRYYDEKKVDVILARGHDQKNGRGFSIMNRMLKAAGYEIVNVGE